MASLKNEEKEVFFEEIMEYLSPQLKANFKQAELNEAAQLASNLDVFQAAKECYEARKALKEAQKVFGEKKDWLINRAENMFPESFVRSKIIDNRYGNADFDEKDLEKLFQLLTKKVYCKKNPTMGYSSILVRKYIQKQLVLASRPKNKNNMQFLVQLKEEIAKAIIGNPDFMVNLEPGAEDDDD